MIRFGAQRGGRQRVAASWEGNGAEKKRNEGEKRDRKVQKMVSREAREDQGGQNGRVALLPLVVSAFFP